MKEKIAQFFWPPLRAHQTNELIDSRRQQQGNALWTAMHERVRVGLRDYKKLEASLNAATELCDNESKRKETIESKASVIVQSVGITTSIVGLAAALLDKRWVLSFWWSSAVVGLYFIAILHLLVAGYYAVKARRVNAYTMPSADTLIDLIERSSGENIEVKLIAKKISDTKWNEDALTIKANELSVAEDLFLRGLAFFAASVTIAILRTVQFYAEKQIG